MAKYSEDFKNRCKEACPNSKTLHRALDSNSPMVGRLLNDCCNIGVSIYAILAATSLEEVKELARKQQIINNLYNEWYDNYR